MREIPLYGIVQSSLDKSCLFIIDKKDKLGYCRTPKVASTTWLALFDKMWEEHLGRHKNIVWKDDKKLEALHYKSFRLEAYTISVKSH